MNASFFQYALAFGVGLAVVSACAPKVPSKQAELDKISEECRLPRGVLQMKGDELSFAPALDTKYDAIDCALKAIKNIPGIKTKMGFIGNERYGDEQDNNAQKN